MSVKVGTSLCVNEKSSKQSIGQEDSVVIFWINQCISINYNIASLYICMFGKLNKSFLQQTYILWCQISWYSIFHEIYIWYTHIQGWGLKSTFGYDIKNQIVFYTHIDLCTDKQRGKYQQGEMEFMKPYSLKCYSWFGISTLCHAGKCRFVGLQQEDYRASENIGSWEL